MDKAVKEHFAKRKSHPLASHPSHAIINYDAGRPAPFITGIDWIRTHNLARERIYRADARRRCGLEATDEEVQAFIDAELASRNAGKQHPAANQSVVDEIVNMIGRHAREHPLISVRPDLRTDEPHNPWVHWERQVLEMYNLCKERGESWAWEYLWKNWYSSDIWRIWSRSANAEYPIINTNAPVESLWTTIKSFLRKRKEGLTGLGRIIMKKYHPTCRHALTDRWLPRRRQVICGLREGKERPSWYKDFTKKWRHIMGELAKEARESIEPETLFNRQQRLYHADADEWWCGCPAYQSCPYHLCKHLVRMVSAHLDPSGRQFVFQPFNSLLHRQSKSPLIFLEGHHEENQRTYDRLDDNFWRPNQNVHAEPGVNVEPPAEIIEDEDDESSSDDSEEDETEDARGDARRDVRGDARGDVRGDVSGDEHGAGESENVIPHDQDLDEEQLDELRAGEELKTHLRIFLDEVDELRNGITDMLEYEPGHRHLREAPRAGLQHAVRWMNFIQRKRTLQNLHGLVPTFDRRRRDMIFSSQN